MEPIIPKISFEKQQRHTVRKRVQGKAQCPREMILDRFLFHWTTLKHVKKLPRHMTLAYLFDRLVDSRLGPKTASSPVLLYVFTNGI